MRKYLLILLLTTCSSGVFAQLKKSKVIVFGDNEAAWAAAVQAARSGVNTIWLRPQKNIGPHFINNERIEISTIDGLDAGLWAEFLSKTRGINAPTDSVSNLAKRDINTQIARNVFEGIADSLKNLYPIFNVEIKSIRKTGKQWQVELSNREKLKVNAIIDATEEGHLLSLIKNEDLTPLYSVPENPLSTETLYSDTRFRTGLFVFEEQKKGLEVPAQTLLNTPAENFFVLNQYPWVKTEHSKSPHKIPLLMLSGQVLGASAAYCAFFKTTTDKINIRTLQGELLTYHGQLIPFQDIAIDDPHFTIIQRIGAAGILKGQLDKTTDSFVFNPESNVSSKEIEPIILALYTRSQIWFSDKDIKELALSDVLSLIRFTALKGEELDADVEKGWKRRFLFSGDFTPNACISRRQLAVLIDFYLKPFNVKVDNDGKFKY